MTKMLGWLVAALALLAGPAQASFHLFAIRQVFSTADGEVQFVVLRERSGANGEHLWAGHSMTAQHGSTIKRFTFPGDLPSGSTANRSVLVATQGYADLRAAMPAAGLPAADYIVPNRFFPTDGGNINYSGVDIFAYNALPVDGTNALFTGGTVAPNQAMNFAGASATVPVVPVSSVEFFNAQLDHYFQSSLAPDIDALDSGRIAGWTRTGEALKVLPAPASTPAPFVPVCRFLIPPVHGDSHFFSAWDVECNRILQLAATDPNYSGYVQETASAFHAVLPDLATGACPPGTRPVNRLWNGRVDSNHRFVVSAAIRAQMIARGYVPEGFGTEGVAMCTL